MKTREERIAAARERILARYPDRDAIEVALMTRFKGKTVEELADMYKKASAERQRLVDEEAKRREEDR